MKRLLGISDADDPVKAAAWIARCVGRLESAPLTPQDVDALAGFVVHKEVEPGGVLFRQGEPSSGVWIVRGGIFELVVGTGNDRTVVELLRAGDVDGDVELLLEMPFPYTARATQAGSVFYIDRESFEKLLAAHPPIARRWLSSVARRVSMGQRRLLDILGRSLSIQVARLLLGESTEGNIQVPQRTLAAMLGVRRPSLNRVLKNLERKGMIEIAYAEIRVTNRELLGREAQMT